MVRRFPYKPRAPRVPPQAPEPDTPQQSDFRLLGHMLRIVITALILVAAYGVSVANGSARGLAGLAILVGGVVCAVVPDLRARAHRAWLWYGMGWWVPTDEDDEP